MVALATTDADYSRNTDRAEVGDDKSRLHAHFYRGCSEHVGTANDKAAFPTHIDLPALYIEVVRTVNF